MGAPMSPVGDVALSLCSGRCFYTLLEVMGPFNWPACHSSSKDRTMVNMHRANYMGIPLGPEPLYALLFLWPDQQTPAIYQSPPHPHWCLLRKRKSQMLKGLLPPLPMSPFTCADAQKYVWICKWCLHRSRCLPHALPFTSLYRLRMHPGLQSNWVPFTVHPVHQIPVRENALTSARWWLFMIQLNSLGKEWQHMTGTHTSTFRSSLTVFSIMTECIWYVGRGIPSWSTSGTSFSKGIINTELHTSLHVRAHQETHHVSFPESTFHNAAQHYKQPHMHLDLFSHFL